MEEAAEGHFTTEAQQWNQDERSPTISGQVIFILRPKISISVYGSNMYCEHILNKAKLQMAHS